MGQTSSLHFGELNKYYLEKDYVFREFLTANCLIIDNWPHDVSKLDNRTMFYGCKNWIVWEHHTSLLCTTAIIRSKLVISFRFAANFQFNLQSYFSLIYLVEEPKMSEASLESVEYECIQCEYKTAVKGTLKQHIQSIHEGIKYPCNHCDHEATQRGNLQTHIQSKHEGIKYPCNQCDYQSTEKGSLKRHIQSQHAWISWLPFVFCVGILSAN